MPVRVHPNLPPMAVEYDTQFYVGPLGGMLPLPGTESQVVGGAVTGRVVDGRGLPRPGVWVYAHPFQGARFGDAVGVHTRADGTWWLPLVAGRWQVRQPGRAPEDITVGGGLGALTGASVDTVPDPDAAVMALLERREARDSGEPAPNDTDGVAALLARRGKRAVDAPEADDTVDVVGDLLRRRGQRSATAPEAGDVDDVVGELLRRRTARAIDDLPVEEVSAAVLLSRRRHARLAEATAPGGAPSTAESVARLLARRHPEE